MKQYLKDGLSSQNTLLMLPLMRSTLTEAPGTQLVQLAIMFFGEHLSASILQIAQEGACMQLSSGNAPWVMGSSEFSHIRFFMLKAILLNRSKLWRERFGTCQVHSSVSCFLCAHKSCKQFLHKGPYSMKGEGYTVPACQGNCSLTSRTAPWKVEEMDQSSSH